MRAPVPSSRVVRVLVVLAFLVGAGAIAWLFYETLTLSVQENAASAQRDRLSTTVTQQGQAIAEANRRLEEAGKTPVAVPSAPSPVPQVSEFRIAQAVSAYLAANPVKNGTNGPTTAQVVAEVTPEVHAAVLAYLEAHPAPAGKTGATGSTGATGAAGKNGTNGTNGSPGAPGAPGPGPSDAQVAAAVKSYCDAHDGCQGPAGPTGATGPTGPAGATGPAGKDGTSAVPFSFTFTVQDNPVQSTTYTCTVTAPNTTAACSKN